MARKNMGKVKRYRRSFYSGGQQLRRILGAVLAPVSYTHLTLPTIRLV